MVTLRPVVVFAVLLLGACQLPPSSQVLYRCADSGACGASFQCWPDGFCHPLTDAEPPRDGGSDAGPRDGGTDAGVDAGLPDAGEVDGGLDAGVDAGIDAGPVDAGVDGGFDAGPCIPIVACPGSAQCGTFDAGCGQALECGVCSAPDECGTLRANTCSLPKLCTQGFCWENPLPQGNTLLATFAFSARAVWAVGEAGTVVFWNGERTYLVDVGTTVDLRGIHASNPNDIYVVGDQGTIIHFGGTTWQREATPGVYRINVVWVAPNGTVFAGANGGAILKRVAGVWTEMSFNPATSTTDIVGLVGLDTGEVYATSVSRVWRLPTLVTNSWVGDTIWPGMQRDPMLMTAIGGQLFAGGKVTGQNFGTLSERQADAGWRQYGSSVPTGFSALIATAAGPFVGTNAGSVTKLERDGGLASASLSRDGGLFALTPLADDTVFVVGESGTMALVGDAGVRELSWGGTATVNGLCGYADSNAYGAANGLVVYERRASPTGVRWDSIARTVTTGVTRWLSCFADGANRVWVVGDDRYFLRQSGGVFVQGDTGNNASWFGVWGSRAGPWYFINSASQIYSTATGDAPNPMNNTNGAGQGIWGVADDDLLVVSTNGLVRSHTSAGNNWIDLGVPETNRFLRAVHAQRFADGGVLYSVVGTGTAWRRINGAFVADGIDAGHVLRGTWVTPLGDIWADGDDGGNTTQGRGVLWHLVPDAGPWAGQPSPTTRPLNTMMGFDDTGPFLGGAGGVILRKLGTDGG